MKNHPKNPEFRNNPENFHPCDTLSRTVNVAIISSYLSEKRSKTNNADPDLKPSLRKQSDQDLHWLLII